MHSIKEINIKHHIYYFFDDMINIKNFDPNKIRRSLQKKNNNVNSLYLFINRINGYIEESNRNKCFTLVPTDESKDTLKISKSM